MHFEEVEVLGANLGYEIEYISNQLLENDVSAKNPASTAQATIESSTESGPVLKRKKPIIRKPGEIVTPIHVKNTGPVKVSTTPSIINTPPTKIITVTDHVPWMKKEPPMGGMCLTSASTTVNGTENVAQYTPGDNTDHQYFGAGVRSSTNTDVPSTDQTQMDRIEKKLDVILKKLNQHDEAFKVIKYNIRDLRLDMKNIGSTNSAKEKDPIGLPYEPVPIVPPPPKRKRQVVFPVIDDNYLLRLEDLFQADNEIRDEVTTLFKEAPCNSLYDFLRKNIKNLFANCSKYTWTGKPSNAMPTMPPSNVASKLALVDQLISVAWDVFPNLPREAITKEFRRALANYNDAVYCKRRKRSKKHHSKEQNDEDNAMDASDTEFV